MVYFVGPEIEGIAPATINEVGSFLKTKDLIGLDTETSGLRCKFDRLLMLQVGDDQDQYVIDVRCTDISPLKEYLERVLCIGHNIAFDRNFLRQKDIVLRNVHDTEVTERVLYCGYDRYGYGLADLIQRYTGEYMAKEVRQDFLRIGDKPFKYRHVYYGAMDIKKLPYIRQQQLDEAKRRGLTLRVRMENRAVIPVSNMSYRGMYINKERWLAYANEARKETLRLEKELDEALLKDAPEYYCPSIYVKQKNGGITLEPFIGGGLFGDIEADRKTSVNWHAPQQLKEILKKVYDFEIIVTDKQKKDADGNLQKKQTVNVMAILKVKDRPPITDLIIKYSERFKEVSTYGEAFIEKHVQPDGFFRSKFNQIQATSRMASKSPNAQNIPAVHRGFIEALPGRKLVVCDYSQQEPRITAEYCKDPKLVDFVLNGDGDLHSLIASAVFTKIEGKEVKVSKDGYNPYSERFQRTYREVGKQINLGLDYGKTAFSIKDDLGVSLEEAQGFIDAIKEYFPEKEAYFRRKFEETWENGYILHDPVTQGKTYIPDFDKWKNFNPEYATKEQGKDFERWKGALMRLCQNYPIQGTAAAMTKTALILIQEQIDTGKYGDAWLCNAVHDEIVGDVDDKYSEAFAFMMKEMMVKAGKVFCKTIPMKVDPVISQHWEK